VTAALSPELALAYVRELSTAVSGGVVLSATGRLLAGDPAIAAPAGRLLAIAGEPDFAVRTARGVVVGARAPDGTALVVVCTSLALERVTAPPAAAPAAPAGPAAAAPEPAPDPSAPDPSPADSALLSQPREGSSSALREAAETVISATNLGI
jgi:hypothetical protein